MSSATSSGSFSSPSARCEGVAKHSLLKQWRTYDIASIISLRYAREARLNSAYASRRFFPPSPDAELAGSVPPLPLGRRHAFTAAAAEVIAASWRLCDASVKCMRWGESNGEQDSDEM